MVAGSKGPLTYCGVFFKYPCNTIDMQEEQQNGMLRFLNDRGLKPADAKVEASALPPSGEIAEQLTPEVKQKIDDLINALFVENKLIGKGKTEILRESLARKIAENLEKFKDTQIVKEQGYVGVVVLTMFEAMEEAQLDMYNQAHVLYALTRVKDYFPTTDFNPIVQKVLAGSLKNRLSQHLKSAAL